MSASSFIIRGGKANAKLRDIEQIVVTLSEKEHHNDVVTHSPNFITFSPYYYLINRATDEVFQCLEDNQVPFVP